MTISRDIATGYKGNGILKTLGKAALGLSLIASSACGIHMDRVYDSNGNVRASHYSFFGNGSNQMIDGDKVVNDAKQQYIQGYGWGLPTIYGGYYSPYSNQWWYPSTLTTPIPWFQGPGLNGGYPYRINKNDKEKPQDFALTGLEDIPSGEYEIIADLVEKHRNQKKATI